MSQMYLWLKSLHLLVVQIPVQVRQARVARVFAETGEIPEEYWRLVRRRYFWGSMLPAVSLYWMVFKPL